MDGTPRRTIRQTAERVVLIGGKTVRCCTKIKLAKKPDKPAVFIYTSKGLYFFTGPRLLKKILFTENDVYGNIIRYNLLVMSRYIKKYLPSFSTLFPCFFHTLSGLFRYFVQSFSILFPPGYCLSRLYITLQVQYGFFVGKYGFFYHIVYGNNAC